MTLSDDELLFIGGIVISVNNFNENNTHFNAEYLLVVGINVLPASLILILHF